MMVNEFYISQKRNRRFGCCAWCGKKDVKLTMTVHKTARDYRVADVCEQCLRKFSHEGGGESGSVD